MISHSECELDLLDCPGSDFLERIQGNEPRRQGYEYVTDRDYVPAELCPLFDYNNNETKVRNKPSQPDGTLEEEFATANNPPDGLVPNWLAWVVLIGTMVAVLAIAGWAVFPTSIFLWLTAVGVAVVTVGLFYGQHYLNEHNY